MQIKRDSAIRLFSHRLPAVGGDVTNTVAKPILNHTYRQRDEYFFVYCYRHQFKNSKSKVKTLKLYKKKIQDKEKASNAYRRSGGANMEGEGAQLFKDKISQE